MNILKSKYIIIIFIYLIYSAFYLLTRNDYTYKIIESTIILFILLFVFFAYDKFYKTNKKSS